MYVYITIKQLGIIQIYMFLLEKNSNEFKIKFCNKSFKTAN